MENELCDVCGGAGVVDDLEWDEDAGGYIIAGEKPCICQIKIAEYEPD